MAGSILPVSARIVSRNASPGGLRRLILGRREQRTRCFRLDVTLGSLPLEHSKLFLTLSHAFPCMTLKLLQLLYLLRPHSLCRRNCGRDSMRAVFWQHTQGNLYSCEGTHHVATR